MLGVKLTANPSLATRGLRPAQAEQAKALFFTLQKWPPEGKIPDRVRLKYEKKDTVIYRCSVAEKER